MQSVKRTRREMSRLVLRGTMGLLMAGLIAGCTTTTDLTELTELKEEIANINNQITSINNSVASIDNRITNVDNRVTNVDNRVTNIDNRVNEWLKTSGEGLDYRITYNFKNFDAVADSDQERKARQEFFKDLKKWLDRARRERGFQVDYKEPPNTPREVDFLVTLENAQARSAVGGPTHESQLEAEIRNLAERAQDPQLAVPVRRDETPAPLLVRHVTVDHNATSGIGRTVSSSKCEQETTFTVRGIPKTGADAFVYDKYTKQTRRLVEEFSIKHPCGASLAEILRNISPPHAFILVKLQDPVVAQYRSLDLIAETEQQIPVPLTEGAPACPPNVIPSEAFKDKRGDPVLGGCV